MDLEFKKALLLFNEKAEKLSKLSFTKAIFKNKSGVTFSWKQGESFQVTRLGPDEEAIDAFVLTYRFFIQNNEKSSFNNLATLYSNRVNLDKLKEEFASSRNNMNDYLDGYTYIHHNNEQLSRRKIMEVFIWGGLSHANEDKKNIYENWQMGPLFQMFQNEFVVILYHIFTVIFFIKSLNEKVIESLENI